MPAKTNKNGSNPKVGSKEFETIEVPTKNYLDLPELFRIKEYLSIALSNHSYYPRVDDLQSDWVAHIATPAFKLLRDQYGHTQINSFCSIGTGSGLDVLSAIEILGVKRVGLTDLHEDVVATAVNNISLNHLDSHQLIIESGYGDLLTPLSNLQTHYDLIYENLPNVPLFSAEEIAEDRKSSTHLAPRTEKLPGLIKNQMLDLHYLALLQAKDFLAPEGAVLSALGGRVPLQVFLDLGSIAGYSSSFLTYTWKDQADYKEIIQDYAQKQKEGFGPFYFYSSEVLQKTFASVDIANSGKNAIEIERSLLSERLDAASANEALKRGERIGHTVAILKSELK